MKKNYDKKRFKKNKEKNRLLRLIRFLISVGIVPDILLLYKNLWNIKKRENENELRQKEIQKKEKKTDR